MYEYLDQVAEDIYNGYLTYDSFEHTLIIAAERIGQAKCDKVDDYLIYIKMKLREKYSTINYILE